MGNVYIISSEQEISENASFINRSKSDNNWIHLKLTNNENYEVITGKSKLGIYQAIVSSKYANWEYRIMDCITYIEASPLSGFIEITKQN